MQEWPGSYTTKTFAQELRLRLSFHAIQQYNYEYFIAHYLVNSTTRLTNINDSRTTLKVH